jgi:hypothetical protein
MSEQEYQETEPTPAMDVSNNTDIAIDNYDDCTITCTYDHNETMLGLNTSSYHFINTQEQDTSTEVKDETCN